MRLQLVVLLLSLASCAQSQVRGGFLYIHGKDTTHVPFLYLGKDTLDYADGGCMRTSVRINSIRLDSIAGGYWVEGSLTDWFSGEDFGNWGLAFLGRIQLIKAKTWIGETTTGKFTRESPPVSTDKGLFKVLVPSSYDGYLILTGLGATVVDLPFGDLLRQHSKQ